MPCCAWRAVTAAGDAGASAFIPMLRLSKHMKRFRVTSRVSRAVGEQIGTLLKDNQPKKKGVMKKPKKK